MGQADAALALLSGGVRDRSPFAKVRVASSNLVVRSIETPSPEGVSWSLTCGYAPTVCAHLRSVRCVELHGWRGDLRKVQWWVQSVVLVRFCDASAEALP